MSDEKPNLPSPIEGNYHRNEWMIMGAPRKRAREIAFEIYSEVANDLNLLFMDNDHNTDKRIPISFAGEFRFRINYYNFAYRTEQVEADHYGLFAPFDGILVSGNHYATAKQIVVINRVRMKALERRIDSLTNVVMFILDDQDQVFEFLLDNIEGAEDIPVFSMDEPGEIAEFLQNEISENIPELNGLIITQEGEQDVSAAEKALSRSCQLSYVSGSGSYDTKLKVWKDDFLNMGMIGSVLTAFKNQPDCAFLTLPADMKSVDRNIVDELNSYRDTRKMATCFMNEEDEPSPYFVIWEPRAYPEILKFIARGYSDISYILRNINSEVVKTPSHRRLKRG